MEEMRMQNKIDQLFQLWKDHEGAGGQVVVTYKGETIFEKCYGYANIELNVPMTQDSVFHVASVTKPFTAMCMMILHERGLINVYDDVRKYIPDLIRFSEPLTIKQMLNHVSGLREYYDLFYLNGRTNEDHIAQREARDIIAMQDTLNFAPGSKFLYTNANYMFCATIVERVTGLSFPEFCKQNIFEPLGMDQSFIRDNARRIVPNKVSSYHDNGYEYTNAVLTFGLYGGTSLHTTCQQLQKFARQFIEPTLISRETMENIMFDIPEVNGKKGNYACGVRINQLEGHRYIHHGGVNAGYRTVMQVYPEDDLIITAFTNTYNIPIEATACRIARVVFGLPFRPRKNLDEYRCATPIPEDIDGTYFCRKNFDHFSITTCSGKVYLDGVPMVHLGDNIYQQGRREIWIALGEQVVIQEGQSITVLEKAHPEIPAEKAAEYVGSYYCKDAQGHFDVVYENGCLYLKHLRHGTKPLYPAQEDLFFYAMKSMRFFRDADGNVAGYLYSSGHLTDIPFVKL